jgi:hypothetical protein
VWGTIRVKFTDGSVVDLQSLSLLGFNSLLTLFVKRDRLYLWPSKARLGSGETDYFSSLPFLLGGHWPSAKPLPCQRHRHRLSLARDRKSDKEK